MIFVGRGVGYVYNTRHPTRAHRSTSDERETGTIRNIRVTAKSKPMTPDLGRVAKIKVCDIILLERQIILLNDEDTGKR